MKIEIFVWLGWLLLLDAGRATVDKLRLYRFQAGRDFLYFGQIQNQKCLIRMRELRKKSIDD